MAKSNHNWSSLQKDDFLLECNSTGLDFWDIKKHKVEYCPACGDKI